MNSWENTSLLRFYLCQCGTYLQNSTFYASCCPACGREDMIHQPYVAGDTPEDVCVKMGVVLDCLWFVARSSWVADWAVSKGYREKDFPYDFEIYRVTEPFCGSKRLKEEFPDMRDYGEPKFSLLAGKKKDDIWVNLAKDKSNAHPLMKRWNAAIIGEWSYKFWNQRSLDEKPFLA